MDDSDRSRGESSEPEDDSVADRAVSGETGETAADAEADDDTTEETDEGVSAEVTPTVTSEIRSGGPNSDSSDDGHAAGEEEDASDDDEASDDADDGDGTPATVDDIDNDVDEDEDQDGNNDGDENEDQDGDNDSDENEDQDNNGSGEDDAFAGIEGPETDEEMPLAAHIEEMMRRLGIVFAIGGLATLVVVFESTALINYFWNYHIPAPVENRPRLYGPLELPLTRLKVAGLAGVVVGLPAFVYETYRFMKPGLYEHERRYYLAAVPTSLVLGTIGIAFAHFLVLPAIFSYFTTYTADAATIAFGLAETFNLIVIMLAFMAIVFQIPLFIMLAIMMNLVTREWLEAKRLLFWGAFLGIAFLFSPDPTGMAPIIVTLTMIVLFEGTLAILRWTGN